MKKNIQTRWNILQITVLVSYSVPDNVWGSWLFIIELPIVTMLNPLLKTLKLKVVLCKRLTGLLELKLWALENKKSFKNKKP